MTFNVALIGPPGHGKTTLAERLRRARVGKTDKLEAHLIHDQAWSRLTPRVVAFAFGAGDRAYVGFDAPGHPRLARRNSRLLSSVDAVVLVISPLELAPEDGHVLLEQLSVAHHLGAARIVGFTSKLDLFASKAERAELQALLVERVAQLCSAAGYEVESDVSFVGGEGDGLEGARRLEATLDCLPKREAAAGSGLLPVFRGCTVVGRGAIALGVVARGRLFEGQELSVLGKPKRRGWEDRPSPRAREWRSKVLSLRVLDEPRQQVQAGEAVAALVQGDPPTWSHANAFSGVRYVVRSGMVLAEPGTAALVRRFRARVCFPVHLLHRRLEPSARFLFHLWFARVVGRLDVDAQIEPGDRVMTDVVLDVPTFAEPGLRFVMRGESIVALGEVTSIEPVPAGGVAVMTR